MSEDKNLLKKLKWKFRLFAWFKIPLIGFVKPKIISINEKETEIKIRLNRRTKNHLNSMYFGALAVGADIASAIHVIYFSEKLNKKVSFAFKSIHGEFVKRAESDVVFFCDSGDRILKMIQDSELNGQRINQNLTVQAKNQNGEMVATFEMELSVRTLKA